MEIYFLSSQPLFLLLLLSFTTTHLTAQSTSNNNTGTDFSCSVDSPPSCETYVAYLAQPPTFLEVGNISDLFQVSRLSVAQSNNLVSENNQLFPCQLLLVPITCGCTGNRYFANITYQNKNGDSFFRVSTTYFENLTNWHVMEQFNPDLSPNLLPVDVKVIAPLFCSCPSNSSSANGTKYLITYVWQPGDDASHVSTNFDASSADIIRENKNLSTAVGLPVLIPVSQLPALSQSYPSDKNKSKRQRILIGKSLGSILSVLFFTTLLERERRVSRALIRFKQTRQQSHRISYFLGAGVSDYLGRAILYDIKVVMEATMNLNENCRIGGLVYKAIIDEKVLAIKKFDEDVTEELKILQKVSHVNLVKLMSMSSDSDGNYFLDNEFAENGSLDKRLYSKSSAALSSVVVLTWIQRLNIALDVANGLQYMA